MQISLFREQVSSLETKCSTLLTQIERDAVQHREGEQSHQAIVQQNLKLGRETAALVSRAHIAEGAQAALEQQNEQLKQQVMSHTHSTVLND